MSGIALNKYRCEYDTLNAMFAMNRLRVSVMVRMALVLINFLMLMISLPN